MTRVYGGCIEPGGMDLEGRTEEVPCPSCGKPALRRYVELCEGGSINTYDYVRCRACGYRKGEAPDYNGWFDPEDPAYAIPDDDQGEDDEDDPAFDPPADDWDDGWGDDRQEQAGPVAEVPQRRGGRGTLAVYSAGLLLLGTVLGLAARRPIPRR